MKIFNGNSFNISSEILGKVSKKNVPFLKRKNTIFVNQENNNCKYGYKAIISKDALRQPLLIGIPNLHGLNTDFFDYVSDKDIISINREGACKVLWEYNSHQNSILITEQCNCNCWMCPQPPKKDYENINIINKKILNLLDVNSAKDICITGGEPTIFEDRLVEYLSIIKKKFPGANVHILTNGKNFDDFNFAKTIAKIGLSHLIFCISLHSDIDTLHDWVCRSKGSFQRTINGIYNLAKLRQKIEIRFVINKINYSRMHSFSHFVYRNFPFTVHTAFMGLEISGFARKNFDRIWVDPYDYQNSLNDAVLDLYRRGLNVSIYNIPLCLIPREIWKFARKSISEWKNSYLEVCSTCNERVKCCGVFSTSDFNSSNIAAI